MSIAPTPRLVINVILSRKKKKSSPNSPGKQYRTEKQVHRKTHLPPDRVRDLLDQHREHAPPKWQHNVTSLPLWPRWANEGSVPAEGRIRGDEAYPRFLEGEHNTTHDTGTPRMPPRRDGPDRHMPNPARFRTMIGIGGASSHS